MKKILIPLLIIILVFLIYKFNEDDLIDYMVIGDSISCGINSYGNKTYGYNDYLKNYLNSNNLLHKYNNYFSKDKYTIKELLNDIKNNKNIIYNDKNYNLKKELRESDILTISIGMDEIVNILNKNKDFKNIKTDLDEIINDMDNLIKIVTSYSKTNVILIGYYNPYNEYNKDIDKVFSYINDKYNSIAKKYNIIYIDIYNIIKKDKTYLPNKIDYHLTSKGYLEIAKEVIEKNNL